MFGENFWSQNGPFLGHFGTFRGQKRATAGSKHAKTTFFLASPVASDHSWKKLFFCSSGLGSSIHKKSQTQNNKLFARLDCVDLGKFAQNLREIKQLYVCVLCCVHVASCTQCISSHQHEWSAMPGTPTVKQKAADCWSLPSTQRHALGYKKCLKDAPRSTFASLSGMSDNEVDTDLRQVEGEGKVGG